MSEPAASPAPRHKRPWALSFFGILAIAGLVAMPILAGPPAPAKMPDLIRFLGHFHPVILHLPIGVFILILVQELGAIFFRRPNEGRPAPVFPMFFASASAILAVLAGFMLYHGGGYEENATAERHLWGGLAFAILSVITLLARAWSASPTANPAFFRLMLFVSTAVMGFASHDGAALTHGENYLTQYAPEPLRKLLGVPAKTPPLAEDTSIPLADQVAYSHLVAPILERRCVQCHKESKTKGGIRMDTYELLMKGGKKGPIIIPGDAAKSRLIQLIELPIDDIDHMPPEGKPQPTKEELVVLKWWINQGADAAKPIKELAQSAEETAAIQSLAPSQDAVTADAESAPATESPAATTQANEALAAAVASLTKEFPGSVTFESQQGTGISFTAASLRGSLDDTAFAKFAPIIPHLVTLDCSATKITDQSVAQLIPATNLRMVRLAETTITDAAIESLVKIPSLQSVNLYGTKVTDAGIAKLATLPNLKHLYLWQTAVTPAAITALKEKLPSCEIITGL